MARDFGPVGFAMNIDRRTLLARSAQAVGAAVLIPSALRSARAADAPVVETTAGKIRGVAAEGVMAGLVPAIHVLPPAQKAWMRGTSPRMTVERRQRDPV